MVQQGARQHGRRLRADADDAEAVLNVSIGGGLGSLGFSVKAEDKALADRLQAWRGRVSDLTSFWVEKFAPRFLGDIQSNWDSGGGMVGGWAPNAPGYAAWKARSAGAHLGVLEYSLRLRGSMQWLNSGAGGDIGPEGIFRPMPTGVEIGTSVPYAYKHQYGRDGMVQRRFLFMADAGQYDGLWREWVLERARESGIQAA